ncbi:MAG TPA: hypothetical protein VKE22_16070 [Haliangiales bacterium]|nr:hypothetical protein [Haliangiales bacterium]
MRRGVAIVVVSCLLVVVGGGGGNAMAWSRCPMDGAPAASCCCPDEHGARPCAAATFSGRCCETGVAPVAATGETRSQARVPSAPVAVAFGATRVAVATRVLRPTVRRERPPEPPTLLAQKTSLVV